MRAPYIGILIAVVLCTSISAEAQQCGKGETPSPTGCIRVCPPGDYIIEKKDGFDTCVREGNQEIGTHRKRYALLPIAAGTNVDGICFGIRDDERVETVVDDRFLSADWHVDPRNAYVAEISYTVDPGLTKLHLVGFRYWLPLAKGKPAVGDLMVAHAEVPLYDQPQPNCPCTKQQWAAIMTPPQVYATPRDDDIPIRHSSGGAAPLWNRWMCRMRFPNNQGICNF
jgi:hypothetical protein